MNISFSNLFVINRSDGLSPTLAAVFLLKFQLLSLISVYLGNFTLYDMQTQILNRQIWKNDQNTDNQQLKNSQGLMMFLKQTIKTRLRLATLIKNCNKSTYNNGLYTNLKHDTTKSEQDFVWACVADIFPSVRTDFYTEKFILKTNNC